MFLRDLLSRVLEEANDAKGLDFGRYVEMVGDIAKAERDLAEARCLMRDFESAPVDDGSSVVDADSDSFDDISDDLSADDADESVDAISGEASADDVDESADDASSDETFEVSDDVDVEPLRPNGDLDSTIMDGAVETSSFAMGTVSGEEYADAPMPFGIAEEREVAVSSE